MANDTTRLHVTPREIAGSRANRRLRRAGRVPAVIYGGDAEPQHVSVDARELRVALHSAGAVLELELDGETATAVVKEQQRDPVRGDAVHVDFVRVRMDQPIHALVTLELVGAEDAPGVRQGGVLEQQARELNVEALPGDIPETVQFDASGLEAGATLTLAEISAPAGVTFLDDPGMIVASITMPRVAVEEVEEVEAETAGVGEAPAAGEEAEAESEPAGA